MPTDRPIGLGRTTLVVDEPALYAHFPEEKLVHPKEPVYYWLCVAVSLVIHTILFILLAVSGWIFYLPFFWLGSLTAHGLHLGNIRANSVRVSASQFPEIAAAAETMADKLNMSATLPPIYILQSGGALNAFATRFLSRDFVVLYSETVELALEEGEEALNFILAHELGHVKRGHLKRRWLIAPALLLPGLGKAYYRVCEYTCDRIGAYCAPEGAVDGLLALASGKRLFSNVDLNSYLRQFESERGFWTWYSEYNSTHPHLPKRIKALLEAGLIQSARLQPSEAADRLSA